MATSIGPRIGVEGYDSFKTQIDVITSKLKALESEASALEKQYQGHTDSLEYLTKKQDIYNKQLDLQRQRLEEAAKWEEKVKTYVNGKTDATDKDNLAVAKAEELTARYNAGLAGTEAQLKDTTEAVDNYGKNLLTAADAAEETQERSQSAAVAIGNILSRLTEKAAQLGKQAVSAGLEFNAAMESYKASFSTFLGSEEAAGKALDDILASAQRAPTFSIDALTGANRALLAAGLNAEEANRNVMNLATALAAAGQGDDALNRMAINMQQIANNGQAYAIDIKQFANVGIPVWNLLSDYTGKTKEELQGTTVTFDLLSKALAQAAGEGGRYFGSLDKQAATFNGQLNALKNNVTRSLGTVFKDATTFLESSLFPALNSLFSSEDRVNSLVAAIEGATAALALLAAGAKIAGWQSSEEFTKAAARITLYRNAVKEGTIDQAGFTAAMSGTDIVIGLYTGQISAAEAATWLFNTTLSALPFVAVAAAIGGLVAGIKKYNTEIGRVKDENIIDIESVAEGEKHIEELKNRIAELENVWPEFRTQEQEIELNGLKEALKATTEQVQALAAAEAEEQAYRQSTEGQLNSTIDNAKQKLSELYAAYDEAYAKAFEAAQKEFELFEYIEGVSYTSVQEMIKALDSQTLYWENYAYNLAKVRDINFGLSQDLIAFLSDGSAESAGYLQSIINDVEAAGGATSEGGRKIIQDINNSFSNLQQAQRDYADESAKTATNFEEEIAKITGAAVESLEKLEMTEEMRNAAVNDMKSFAAGLSSQSTLLTSQAAQIGQAIAVSLQNGINSVKISLPTLNVSGYSVTDGGNSQIPHHKSGLDYVPYDNYLAYLHKGETVLTAAEAARYRAGNTTNNSTTNYGGVSVNVYAAEGQSVNEIADAVAYRLQSAVEGRERAGN